MASAQKKKISLGLQGGGAYGAFTWGVLDRLLEDDRIEIEGISGTSAGAMTAVTVAQGLMKNGRQGARDELNAYWKMISDTAKVSPMQPSLLDQMLGKHGLDYSPSYNFFSMIASFFSPYQINPFNLDLLRLKVTEFFDFKGLQKFKGIKIFLCATNIKTAKLKIFTLDKLRPECVLASACLPELFHATEVDGEFYWDGGFIGNPALFPLIDGCETSDLLVVALNSLNRSQVPMSKSDISNRFLEISCINTLIREMRAIDFITKLIDDKTIAPGKLKRMNMHLIENEKLFEALSYTSLLNASWPFLTYLFEEGRKTADQWLQKNFNSLGKQSSYDVHKHYVL